MPPNVCAVHVPSGSICWLLRVESTLHSSFQLYCLNLHCACDHLTARDIVEEEIWRSLRTGAAMLAGRKDIPIGSQRCCVGGGLQIRGEHKAVMSYASWRSWRQKRGLAPLTCRKKRGGGHLDGVPRPAFPGTLTN